MAPGRHAFVADYHVWEKMDDIAVEPGVIVTFELGMISSAFDMHAAAREAAENNSAAN